ncbi:hypothetical protein [Lacticaseibacillus zhaodongensis]|uniref:hypothetical protein n=1 Tax=Lacticaseibacillus zhaodongensis TaxID=2668065 RepID=UPI0012D32388|nr:hypothetical protein [Lacticaseibacillus zhaodongensis]
MHIEIDTTAKGLTINLPQTAATITVGPVQADPDAALLLFAKDHQIVSGGTTAEDADRQLALTLQWDQEGEYLQRMFAAKIAGTDVADAGVPAGAYQAVAAVFADLTTALSLLGYTFGQAAAKPAAKRPGKPRHRFDRKLADTPFTVDHDGAHATVYWRKAKEMEIAPGARLRTEQLLNKDGSESYSAKYGDKLRADHAAAIKDGVTTAAVTLRSVNEVGSFLYYGNTNSWLQLLNAEGKTLDELTRIG